MISLLLSLATILGATIYDIRTTSSRISKFGPDVELNPAVAKLAKRLGTKGIAIAITAPNLVILIVAAILQSPILVAALAGWRAAWMVNQLLADESRARLRAILQ